MTYAQPQPQPQPFRGRIALFPPQRPSKVSLSGACSISAQELPEFIDWLTKQTPDQYGNVNLRIALFDTMSKAGRPYLSGYLQPPQQQTGGQAYSSGSPQGFPQAPPQGQSAPQQNAAAYQQAWLPGQPSAAPQHPHAGWQTAPQAQTSLPLQPPSAAPVSSPPVAGSSATQAAAPMPQHGYQGAMAQPDEQVPF